MWKPSIILLFGFTCGAAATAWWLVDRPETSRPTITGLHANSIPADTSGAVPVTTRELPLIPSQTLADINALRSDFEQTMGLYDLMRGMGPTELVSLLDEAALISGEDYVAATSIIIGRLAELDPQRAIDKAMRSATLAQPAWINAVFRSWARLDEDAARDALSSLPRGLSAIAQHGINRAVGNNTTNASPSATIAFAGQGVMLNGPLGLGAPNVAGLDANADLPTAWQEAMNITNMQQRMVTLAQIAAQWAQTDPQSALQASNAMPVNSMRDNIQQQIIMGWAQNDPRAALDWLSTSPSNRRTGNMMAMAIRILAQTDFAEARSFVDGLEGAEKDRAQLGLVEQWAKQDLDGLKFWLGSTTNKMVRQQAIQRVTIHLATKDAQRALEWLADLTDDEAAMGTGIAVSLLANTDMQQAAAFVDGIEKPEARFTAARSLIQHWSGYDPENASQWIQNQTNDLRPQLYRSLTQSWGNHATERALEFAERLPDPIDRDNALLGVLPYLPEDQRQRIAEQVQDAELKIQATRVATRVR